MKKPLILITTLLSSIALKAFDPTVRGKEIAEEARRYTVLIENTVGDPFLGHITGGAGTGVISEIDRKNGIIRIFTNKHVIERNFLTSQKLEVNFFYSPDENPEKLPGKLVYVSNAYDFAVVEVNLKDVQYSKKHIRKAKFAKTKIDEKNGYGGSTPVMAYGHPLLSSNIVTKGSITGYHLDGAGQRFIQTDTTINAGNSGGPLIDMETKEVIGLNTWKWVEEGVHNTNFAIPVNQVIYDYENWKTFKDTRRVSVPFGISLISKSMYETSMFKDVRNLLATRFKEFARKHNGILLVQGIYRKNCPLEMGDIIVEVNGKTVGNEYFYLQRLIQIASLSQDTIKILVIRNGEFVSVDLPLEKIGQPEEENFEYVSFSGIIFGNSHPNISLMTGLKGVQIFYQHPQSEILNLTPGSVVTHVKTFNGQFEELADLADFKTKLKTLVAQGVKNLYLKIHHMPSNRVMGRDGSISEYPSREANDYSNTLSLDGKPTVVVVDVKDLVTSEEAPMNSILGSFDFESSSSSLNLQGLAQAGCSDPLTSVN
jgi:S1-C subfamily serine protease